ncbi:MAG: hypothetical protein ABJH63_18825 [Rhizobiaceae bacterium]
MTKLNKTLLAFAIACFVPQLSYAGSDPADPDCPFVAEMQLLARKVDVFNRACRHPIAQCLTIKQDIEKQAEFAPGLLQTERNGIVSFDPKVVFSTVNFEATNPRVFDCDPDDDDCDGKTTDLRRIHQNIQQTGEGLEVFMSFPMSNFYSIQP